MGLKEKRNLPWNPQSNAILKRIHEVLTYCLTTFKVEDLGIDKEEEDPIEEYLLMASYAIQCAFHNTHGHSPGQLVFRHDMFMLINIPID